MPCCRWASSLGRGCCPAAAAVVAVPEGPGGGSECKPGLVWAVHNLRCAARIASPAATQGKVVAQVQGHQDDVNAVAYAERGSPNIIFSGSDDMLVKARRGRASGQRMLPGCSGGYKGFQPPPPPLPVTQPPRPPHPTPPPLQVWDRRTMGASGRRCRPAGVFVGHTEGITHIDSKARAVPANLVLDFLFDSLVTPL